MKYLLILFVALGLFVFGCVSGESPSTGDSMVKPSDSMAKPTDSMQKPAMVNDSGTMQKTNDSMAKPSDSMPKANSSAMMDDSSLSGYIPFSLEKYNEAKQQGKYIFLEFYASWCPICASQKPHLESAFSDLSRTNSKIVGFQVNYRDDQTDQSETDLARQFGISTQHTHVILDPNGNVVLRSNEMWDSNEIKSQVSRITG